MPKQYRKIQTIEVVDHIFMNGSIIAYKVQNKGNSKDQWEIPYNIFQKTYEEVK